MQSGDQSTFNAEKEAETTSFGLRKVEWIADHAKLSSEVMIKIAKSI